jgi:hypothetical protein
MLNQTVATQIVLPPLALDHQRIFIYFHSDFIRIHSWEIYGDQQAVALRSSFDHRTPRLHLRIGAFSTQAWGARPGIQRSGKDAIHILVYLPDCC